MYLNFEPDFIRLKINIKKAYENTSDREELKKNVINLIFNFINDYKILSLEK